MKKSLSLLAAVLYIVACACNNRETKTSLAQQKKQQDDRFAKDHQAIFASIDSMVYADQQLRSFIMYGTTDEAVIDSINATYAQKGMPPTDIGLTAANADSLNKVMMEMSVAFTRKLTAILSDYGYPSTERIAGYKGAAHNPTLLLVHADTSYKDTLMALLTNEYKYKRLHKNEYEYIKWHLNGRKGIPAMEGVKITMYDKNGKAVNYMNGKIVE